MKVNSIFKKCAIFFLACALLVMCAVPAMAETPITFNEKVTTKSDVVLYEIKVSAESNIYGLSFEVKYEKEQVRLKRCTTGEMLGGGTTKCNTKVEGKVALTYTSNAPLSKAGSVLMLEFVPISTDNRKIDVDCLITKCIDGNRGKIPYNYDEKEILNPRYTTNKQNQSNNSNNSSNSSNNSGATPPKKDPNKAPTAPTIIVGNNTTSPGDKVTNESGGKLNQTIKDIFTQPDQSNQTTTQSSQFGLMFYICFGVIVLLVCVGAILAKRFLLKREDKKQRNKSKKEQKKKHKSEKE